MLIYSKCSFSCALNALGSSMLTIDDGRAFQSVTVLGRKEYFMICRCPYLVAARCMLTIDDGRVFQSVTVLGRKEYL